MVISEKVLEVDKEIKMDIRLAREVKEIVNESIQHQLLTNSDLKQIALIIYKRLEKNEKVINCEGED